jgi:hypothetical protein
MIPVFGYNGIHATGGLLDPVITGGSLTDSRAESIWSSVPGHCRPIPIGIATEKWHSGQPVNRVFNSEGDPSCLLA